MRALRQACRRRPGLGLLIATSAIFLALGTAAQADAAIVPRLAVATLTVPTNLPPGGQGIVRLDVQNIGNAPTDGGTVTVVDRLPAGLTATEAGGILSENVIEPGIWDCSGTTVVTCTNDPTGLPILRSQEGSNEVGGPVVPSIGIVVQVEAGLGGTETNEVEAGGGGSSVTATDRQPLTFSAEPPPFGFASFESDAIEEDGAPDLQAGSHPYSFVTHFVLNNVLGRFGSQNPVSQGPKSLTVDLPAGFIGNPQATPRCPRAYFDAEQYVNYPANCPADTQVGYDTIAAESDSFRTPIPVYNLVPPPGAAAQFGFAFQKDIGFITAGVRTGDGYNLKVEIRNIPQLSLIANTLVIWGTPSDPSHDPRRRCGAVEGCAGVAQAKPLLTEPSSCGVAQALGVAAVSWLGAESPVAQYPISDLSTGPQSVLGGCARLGFEPTLAVAPDTPAADSPAGLSVGIGVPQAGESAGNIASADLKDATVELPAGLVVNPSSANGLVACTEAQIELDGPGAPGCPDASKLGTVEVDTPLLDHPLPGAIYLAQPHQNPFGSLLALYLTVDDPQTGVIVKLPGEVKADPVTGQLTASFKENPQLPFEDLKVNFFGGPRAALTTPPTCGTYTTTTDLTPWTTPEGADAFPASSFQVTGGANGSGCVASEAQLPNKPAFEAGTTNPIAGSYSPFVLKLSREDGSQRFGSLETTLPAGLVGRLAGIPYCSDQAIASAAGKSGKAEQASASCPAASEVGTVNVGAGSGSSPFYVQGKAYLAGPYKGAPISLAIITPAVAGPFDLGTVVVRTALYVNEYSAQVRAVSDPLPSILEGIPLDIRSIALQLSRSDFTLNPSSCEAKEITGSVTSTLGRSAPLKNRFQVGACAALAFKPGLKVSLSGQTKRIGHPALKAVLTYPKGQNANVRRALVNLPGSEFLDQGNLNKTCTKPVLEAGRCPASTVYGKAKAWTPLLEKPLEGPVYLVGGFGYKLPALVAELNGQLRVLLVGKVDSGKNHGIRTTFEAVPDAPVSRFVLEMKGGKKYGLLENSQNICKHKQKAIARFTAQNGKTYDTEPVIQVACGKGKKGAPEKK